jgi:iron(III) transport system substrate-binding protein
MIKMVVFALMSGLFFACAVKDTTLPKTQKVIVYTDCVLKSDEVIFRKFKKEHHIEVFVRPVSADTLLRFLNSKRQHAKVDLFLLKDFSLMQELSNDQVLYPVHSVKLKSKLDYVYRSPYGKWFALGKTPLVFVYNSRYLKSDTISRYSELINKEWLARLALQNKESSTIQCFVQGVQHDLKKRSGEFLISLWKQKQGQYVENDNEVLQKIKRNEANLGMVQLASFLNFNNELKDSKDSLKTRLGLIFPNQRNRGAYQTISSMGMYRFARNPIQTKILMEFLLSRSAQYQYAKNRNEYPMLKGVSPSYELKQLNRYRGRFVRNYSIKNK